MIRGLISLALLLGVSCAASPALAQSVDAVILESAPSISSATNPKAIDPDFCINKMVEFPSDDHEIRYQFFRLTQEMARDVTPEFRNALHKYGDSEVSSDRTLLEAIEDIANPVLRQAAPEITIANMTHVIDFATLCNASIAGQVNSLKAFDNSLEDADFNAVIVEDALFLRQILSDSLFRLGADKDPLSRLSVTQYANTLVTTRDEVEFTTFEAELVELEAVYLNDLDGRLKRSNDIINEEMDREILGDSVALSDSLNKAEKEKAKQRQLYSLIRILGGGG